jgi:hypothetical protein
MLCLVFTRCKARLTCIKILKGCIIRLYNRNDLYFKYALNAF